jgi:hypothetical protein
MFPSDAPSYIPIAFVFYHLSKDPDALLPLSSIVSFLDAGGTRELMEVGAEDPYRDPNQDEFSGVFIPLLVQTPRVLHPACRNTVQVPCTILSAAEISKDVGVRVTKNAVGDAVPSGGQFHSTLDGTRLHADTATPL